MLQWMRVTSRTFAGPSCRHSLNERVERSLRFVKLGLPSGPRHRCSAAFLCSGIIGISLLGLTTGNAGADPEPGDNSRVLLVTGLEYTTDWVHLGVAGVRAPLATYAWQGQPIPPYQQRAADIMNLDRQGSDPLWWFAHPNWRDPVYPPERQITDLLGIIHATQDTWYPDAIALLNVGVSPTYNGDSNWRRQLSIQMGQVYSTTVATEQIPAFLLEVDFHLSPTVFYFGCGAPCTVVFVRPDWHELPATEAMAEVFAAVRARRTLGTVGYSRFVSAEFDSIAASLTLTSPTRHVQLWAGTPGGPLGEITPIATWENTAVASFPLSALPGGERFLFWFAYGDSLIGDWNTWSCRSKQVFFTSPILPTGPGTFANQYAADVLGDLIPIRVFFHQHTPLSPDAPQAPDFDQLMADCRTLGIDCVITTDHTPGLVGPFPDLVAVWDAMPDPADVVLDPLAGDGRGNGMMAVLHNPIKRGEAVVIRYRITRPGSATARLTNARGQVVRTSGPLSGAAGVHFSRIDTSGLSAGVYYVDLDGGEGHSRRSVAIVP